MFRFLALSLIAVAAVAVLCVPSLVADEQFALDVARSRADACIAVQKIAASKIPACTNIECKAATVAAEKAIELALHRSKPAPTIPAPAPAPSAPKAPAAPSQAVLSPDGQTLTRDGRTYQRLPNGTFAEASSATPADSGGCKMVNGRMVCPTAKR